MPARSLPSQPSLTQLKLQARELRRDQRAGKQAAAARIVAHHPRRSTDTLRAVLERPLTLADAQLVVAREYGFSGWPELKHHVEVKSRWAQLKPHPHFDEAVALLDSGNLDGLRALLASQPALIDARGCLAPPLNYFSGATLLHHVAGNPFRSPLPANIIAIARLLLEQGADVHAETLGPRRGATTMGLVITSKHASDAGVSGPLMDLLLAHGAKLDPGAPGILNIPLANHAPAAAVRIIDLGAKVDVCAAAALGRMDLVRECFDGAGRVRPERDAVGLALLFAYVNQHRDAVDFLLEKDGNWNMIGVNNGTALHRAASACDLPMVQRLLAKGADPYDRNNPFNATPFSWAEHAKQHEVFEWMRSHCRIDLHDAVCFDLRDHAAQRIAEDPQSVHRVLDQWDIPRGAPLHYAAGLDRHELVKRLLENGADPNLLAGDGRSPLDVAEQHGHAEVAELIARYGGRRAD